MKKLQRDSVCVCECGFVCVRQESREKDSACVLENERKRKQRGSLISVSHEAAKKNPGRKLVLLVSAGDATRICKIITPAPTNVPTKMTSGKVQIIFCLKDVAVALYH